jgi:hypothetical protein
VTNSVTTHTLGGVSYSSCGLIKYTITPDKLAVLSIESSKSTLLKPNSTTKVQETSTTASVFTDSGPDVKLEFWKTENHNLIDDQTNKNGVYSLTIAATLNDYPLIDELVKIERTFTLTITDVCTDEAITSPIISDMTYEIKPSPLPVEQDFASYTDVNNNFCGTLEYTLTYITGRICSTWNATDPLCVKSKAIITLA